MSLTDDLYKEIIIEHSQYPRHREKLEHVTVEEGGVNRSCGDEIELQLYIEEGVIKNVGVSGHGCSISTASSSLMADAIIGMTLADTMKLIKNFKDMVTGKGEVTFPDNLEDLQAMSGIHKFPVRVKCATLSWNTLEQAIKKVNGA